MENIENVLFAGRLFSQETKAALRHVVQISVEENCKPSGRKERVWFAEKHSCQAVLITKPVLVNAGLLSDCPDTKLTHWLKCGESSRCFVAPSLHGRCVVKQTPQKNCLAIHLNSFGNILKLNFQKEWHGTITEKRTANGA